MKAYSLDVREKALRAVDQGYPRAEIVKLLGISTSDDQTVSETATGDR